jgi:hypothetical protein
MAGWARISLTVTDETLELDLERALVGSRQT